MNYEKLRAKNLYAEHKSPKEIAKILGKSEGTVYRWIKENKEEFEEARKLAEITTDDMGAILDGAHKKMLLKILENPSELKNPKVADAFIKIANVIEKIDLKSEREKEAKKKEEVEERGVLIVDDIKEEKNDKETNRTDNT
ncbi:MAG: hypothetical protein CR959_01870 [Fusobacteriales bacterium]|nr:MAG: hypothetical protein CR959_01870 [Fusobacteriales bacterium]